MSGRQWLFLMLAGILLFAAGIGSGVAGTLLVQNGTASLVVQKQPTSIAKTNAPIIATLLHKRFVPANPDAQDYYSHIVSTLQLQNTGDKDIRAFTGTITYSDLFDKTILDSPLTYEGSVKAGDTVKWDWGFTYRLVDSHLRLKDIAETDLKSSVRVDEVLFTDGTRVKYP